MNQAYEKLARRLGECSDLSNAALVLAWDHRTMMPRTGATARADQLGTVTKILYERLTSPEIGRLLDELEPWSDSLDYDSTQASVVRRTRRDYDKAKRVPPELRAEISRASALAEPVWEEARSKSDFAMFLPHLERNVELKLRYIDCFDDFEEPYDVLLDDYEPGMTAAEVRAVLQELRDGLVPLIAEIADRADDADDSCLRGTFPIEAQQRVEQEILAAFGFTKDSWRLDETVHPFASRSGPDDIRLTTHHDETNLHSIFSSMHEFGHGLYEHGVDRELGRTLLARGASYAMHESQSRMWENLIGRSRAFWRRYFPLIQDAFPDRFREVDAEGFYRAINRVQPSLIRIEADEATYNLHIVVRFELEQDLVSGSLATKDVSDAWDAKMQEYLGVDVPDVADGVLQDTHWASGSIGYFPTYAIGNIISAQLWERMSTDLPDLEGRIGEAEFGPIREWLREHVHRHGRKYMPGELLQRITGTGLDPQPLVRYLRRKLGEIYDLAS